MLPSTFANLVPAIVKRQSGQYQACVQDDYLLGFEVNTLSDDASAFCSCFLSIPLQTTTGTAGIITAYGLCILYPRNTYLHVQNCYYHNEYCTFQYISVHYSSSNGDVDGHISAAMETPDRSSNHSGSSRSYITPKPSLYPLIDSILWNFIRNICPFKCLLLFEHPAGHYNYRCIYHISKQARLIIWESIG